MVVASYSLNPLGVVVARKNAPHVDRSCSSSMNGSDLEKIVHNWKTFPIMGGDME